MALALLLAGSTTLLVLCSEALLNVVNLEIHGNRPVTYVRMRGLKPGALYRDEENGRVYPSDALMETGLPMPVPSGDYDSIQIILKKLA